jgi:hypothetical protein
MANTSNIIESTIILFFFIFYEFVVVFLCPCVLKYIGNPYSPKNQESHENIRGSAQPPRAPHAHTTPSVAVYHASVAEAP